jgi:hypothetical protein
MKSSFNKSIRKKLRELADIAHDRELGQHLSALQEEFGSWKSGNISPHELSDRIHEFHDGPSRDVWLFYNRFKTDIIVARALNEGLIAESEVPEAIRNAIASQIDFFRSE